MNLASTATAPAMTGDFGADGLDRASRRGPTRPPTGAARRGVGRQGGAWVASSAPNGARAAATRSGDAEEALDDVALLARYADGDQAAARELTQRHLGRVLALASRMLGDPAEAEDVAQEAMLRVWRIAGEWDERGAKLSTWVHRVTVNLCYDRLRRRRSASLDEAPEPEDPAPSAQARMEADEGAGLLREALDKLPERQRAAVMLRHFEERSNPEIAEALEVSVEAVESLLSRGRRALKEMLAPRRRELRD